jgi:hypothetical protein
MPYPSSVSVVLGLVVGLAGCIAPEPEEAERSSDLDVGTDVAIPACTTGGWCSEAAPVSGVLLHGVFAVSANDVFAVGDGGTILRRQNGNAWVQMTSGTTANLRGVWASSSTDVWAGGIGGVVLHFDGTSWSLVAGATSDVDAVWGSGPSDVWFCGSSVVLRWTGAGFTKFNFAGTMLAVSGTGPNDVWVTGENTNTHHWNGSAWTTVSPGAGTTTYLTVLAVAPNDVWVSDFLPPKETMHFTGATKWTAQKISSSMFNSMSARSASDIWAVGSGGRIGHWNGSAWSALDQPFGSVAMWSVTTTTGHAWLVGDGSLIAHRAI